jgi:ketosteroid isomerase-like protein
LYNFATISSNSFVSSLNIVVMFKITLIITLALSSMFYTGNAQQESKNQDLAEAKKAIAESNRVYFQAFVKNDPAIFINRYAKDCWIMPPNATAMKGAAAPLEFFKIAYDKIGLRNGKFITLDVFGDGKQHVTEVGIWKSYDASNKLFDEGKFLVLWKKTPAGWKMFRDSFSSDRPHK